MKTKFVLGFVLLGSMVLLYLLLLPANSNGPVGIVVPHHDMVASARAAYFAQVGAQIEPKTIVLLSPDHFGTNRASLVASTKKWQSSVGELIPNLTLIEDLKLTKDQANFDGEHGVTTLLRDIRTYFKDSTIVPVMVHTNTTSEEMERFVNNLYAFCPDCLLIASVDFSHTVEANIASLHDVYTERELQQADAKALIKGAEVDSGATLAALAMWARLHQARRFETFSHTNSGFITGRDVGEMTTHIIGGYSAGEPIVTLNDTVTLQFGGDVMFARMVEETHRLKPKQALSGSLGERFFWGVDAAIVNLEGVFTKDADYQDTWNDFPPKLRFSPVYISALKESRISAVGLANNHSFDGGEVEYQETINLLEKNNIIPLTNRNGDDPSLEIITQGNTKVVIMTIATHEKFNDLAPTIQKYSEQNYFVVVYAHWGNEYSLKPSAMQEVLAKRWIDAGAQLVVGSHPHVVQSVGVYKGLPIIYSLGNLLFDQNDPTETSLGAVLGVKITSEGQELILVPVSTYLKPQAIEVDTEKWTESWHSYKVGGEGNSYFFLHQ